MIDIFGLDADTLFGLLAFGMLLSQLVAKLIPDDATGILGLVRKIAKVLGAYASNRVKAGVSVNDLSKTILDGGLVKSKK